MDKQKTWLITSLFCAKAQWNILLNGAIRAFIERTRHKACIYSCYLEFNYFEGENIRYALLVDNELAKNVAAELDLFFKTFFLNCGFPIKSLTLPVNTIFLPFPSNSIQYGLYSIPKMVSQMPHELILDLSYVLVDALGGDEIDDAIIFTYSLYQHLGWMRAALLFGDQEIFYRALQAFKPIEQFQEKDTEENDLQEKFESNKQLVLEICSDITNYSCQRDYTRIPIWSQKWIQMCLQQLYNAADSFNAFFIIPQIVSSQLGLDKEAKEFLNYVISSIMSQDEMKALNTLDQYNLQGE